VSFTLRAEDLAFYDLGMHRVIESGRITIGVGGNSEQTRDAMFEIQAGSGGSAPVPERCAM
jgi:hypothetical protein